MTLLTVYVKVEKKAIFESGNCVTSALFCNFIFSLTSLTLVQLGKISQLFTLVSF